MNVDTDVTSRPCLFLDRDGVLIDNVPYAKSADSVALRAGAVDLLKKAKSLGHWLICVTNQSGIGRGWVDISEYHAITTRMQEQLLHSGVRLDAIYFAPFYEGATDPRWLEKPTWRKPEPGMFVQACQAFSIDLSKSIMIGDRDSDILAASRAKVARKILLASPDFPDEIKKISTGIEFEAYQNFSDITL